MNVKENTIIIFLNKINNSNKRILEGAYYQKERVIPNKILNVDGEYKANIILSETIEAWYTVINENNRSCIKR